VSSYPPAPLAPRPPSPALPPRSGGRVSGDWYAPTFPLSMGREVCSILRMERLVRLKPGEWSVLAPLLPTPSKKGGRPAKPHRPMVEAMLWILRTGAPWRDLPSAYGPWQSVYTRFSRWSQSGVIAAMVAALSRDHDDEGYSVDATIVRAHQDASGAAKEGAPRNRALARRSVHEDPRRGRRAGKSRALAAHSRADARDEGGARVARGHL